jgi:hypothetical protein
MSIDLEKGIEKLLKGEKLDSTGGDDDEEEGGSDSFSQLDVVKIREEMTKWDAKVGEISKIENVKNNADQLMRDFVVVIRETKYDTASGQFHSQYQNVNVLVGSKDNVDAIKPEIEKFIKDFGGSFKSSFRI